MLSGGASPAADTATTYAPQTSLSDLFADGAGHCFDDVAHHPCVDAVAAHDNLGGNWYPMDSAAVPHSLRSIMVSHGDGSKRTWATGVGCNRDRLGDRECADRLTKAVALWRTHNWTGGLCWFTHDGSDAYSLVDKNGNRRPEWYAYQRAAAAS